MHYTELKIDWLAMVGNAFFLNGIVGKPFGWGTCLLGSGDWTVVGVFGVEKSIVERYCRAVFT